MQALKRLAQPEDIAPVVAFLASDDARLDHRPDRPCRRRLQALRLHRSQRIHERGLPA